MKRLSFILLMFCALNVSTQNQPEFRLNIYGSYVKLQAVLTSIALGAGGGIYFGTGGVSPGLATYSSIFQFSLGGGVVFKPGGKRNQAQQ